MVTPGGPSGGEGAAKPLRGPAAVEIIYFTDPLCCWSWGFEPQIRRLRFGYAGRIAWRTRMGGMIRDWTRFSDPINSVHRPGQMGPLWLQARHCTGMPIEADVWRADPPASSWPSCLAVKTAELQSALAADMYLRRLREAVMLEARNIARTDVLLEVARAVGIDYPAIFDPQRFAEQFGGQESHRALRDDVKEARFRGISRFPCLVMRRPKAGSEILVGWRPYDVLRSALVAAAPELGEERRPESAEAYRRYWTRLTDREVDEAWPGCSEPSGAQACSTDSPPG